MQDLCRRDPGVTTEIPETGRMGRHLPDAIHSAPGGFRKATLGSLAERKLKMSAKDGLPIRMPAGMDVSGEGERPDGLWLIR